MGIVKILDSQERPLTHEEAREVSIFRRVSESPPEVLAPTTSANIVCQLDALERDRRSNNESLYEDLTFIPGTTCQVERLFSATELACIKRHSLSSKMLNVHLFLKNHEKMWDYNFMRYSKNQTSEWCFLDGKDDSDGCIFNVELLE
ncbi:hypothetical protein RCL1_009080 [Eukaryota sp. TZLM3-RCL]